MIVRMIARMVTRVRMGVVREISVRYRLTPRGVNEAPRGCACLEDVGVVDSQKFPLVRVEPSPVDQQVAHLHHPLGGHEGHASRCLPHDTSHMSAKAT